MGQHRIMHELATAAGVLFLAVVLLDAFQTIILPRRPVGRFRITRLFFMLTWAPWRAMARRIRLPRRREQMLSIYGPLSLLTLMTCWALLLIVAFALIFHGEGTPFREMGNPTSAWLRFRLCLYVSGTTLFTLGLGDVTPVTAVARILLVLEAGTGLAFVALVIGYVPVLYTTFSHREVSVAMLDARAGSPPTAGELLARHAFRGGPEALRQLLTEWERWSAELLESHVSYPILCFYRSQHDNQSWLAAITAVLDACALLITTVEGVGTRQAQLTFAMARHTLVDMNHIFHLDERVRELTADAEAAVAPGQIAGGRLAGEEFGRLCAALTESGLSLCASADTRSRLAAIRALYEPQARALSEYLCQELPLWTPPVRVQAARDNWSTVHSLRTPHSALDSLTSHVSRESAASSLHDFESHPH